MNYFIYQAKRIQHFPELLHTWDTSCSNISFTEIYFCQVDLGYDCLQLSLHQGLWSSFNEWTVSFEIRAFMPHQLGLSSFNLRKSRIWYTTSPPTFLSRFSSVRTVKLALPSCHYYKAWDLKISWLNLTAATIVPSPNFLPEEYTV